MMKLRLRLTWWPHMIPCAASIILFIPLAQTLLTVVHGVLLLRPAPRAAWRAGAWPSPACSTHPIYTSFTSLAWIPKKLAIKKRIKKRIFGSRRLLWTPGFFYFVHYRMKIITRARFLHLSISCYKFQPTWELFASIVIWVISFRKSNCILIPFIFSSHISKLSYLFSVNLKALKSFSYSLHLMLQ